MKRTLLLVLMATLMLFAVSGFADTVYDSFAGYQPYWNPLGYPNTATYGETFTAPSDGNNVLQSFSLYLAGPVSSGDIILSGYIASWTGTHAGNLLYTSAPIDYPNTGNAQLSFGPGLGINLTPGATYVAFLSISQYYGQSQGESYISIGNGTIPGGSFVYYNNSGNFNELFTNNWDGLNLQPDLAFTADFNSGGGGGTTPEPGTFVLFGSGLVGALGVIRRKLNR